MPENDVSLLIDAARASGEIARKYWKNNPETWEKDAGAGPVTEADIAVNQMLAHELHRARPDYGWLSEETEDNTGRLNREAVFIIDPIDGTRAFLNGEKTFSHSLAIARNGQVTAAAVYLPMLDLLYSAQSGKPALLNGQPIRATDAAIEQAHILATKPNLSPEMWTGGVPPVKRHFRSSLAYRLCLVAEGKFDGMLTLRDTWEWDVAAGALIAAMSGAQVTDRLGAAVLFNNEHPKLPGMIAAGPRIHTQLINRL